MGQNTLWVMQYGGIFFFSVEVAPQDGVFFICCIFPLQIWGIFLTPMQYGAKHFVGCAVRGIFFFSNIIVL
jgi:hypothetical protein